MRSSSASPLLSLLLWPVLATPASALIVEDCSGSPVRVVNRTTRVEAPGEPVVIRCALAELPGTDGVAVVGSSIVIDGPAGGAIAAHASGPAVSLEATGTITIDAASVAAHDRNGDVSIRAGAGIVATGTTALRAGELLQMTCSGSGCPIDLTAISAEANRLFILAQGDVTLNPRSVLTTHGPTDLIRIASATGDVLAGGGVPVNIPEEAEPGVLVGFRRAVLLEASAYCNCERQPPNKIVTGLEGNLEILAPNGAIDLTAAEVRVGENIDLTALSDVALVSALLQNCGPKKGHVRIAGATCKVASATVLDDDPDAAPALTCTVDGVPTTIGTCSSRN
jgi:hypothetical protein